MDFNQPSQSHPYEPLGESLVWAHGYEEIAWLKKLHNMGLNQIQMPHVVP